MGTVQTVTFEEPQVTVLHHPDTELVDDQATDEFQEVVAGIAPTDDQAYIFVWGNR